MKNGIYIRVEVNYVILMLIIIEGSYVERVGSSFNFKFGLFITFIYLIRFYLLYLGDIYDMLLRRN